MIGCSCVEGAGTASRSPQPVPRTGWALPRPAMVIVNCYPAMLCDQTSGTEKVLPTAPTSKNLNQSEPPWDQCPSMGSRVDPTGPGPPGRVRCCGGIRGPGSGHPSAPSLPRLEPGPKLTRFNINILINIKDMHCACTSNSPLRSMRCAVLFPVCACRLDSYPSCRERQGQSHASGQATVRAQPAVS